MGLESVSYLHQSDKVGLLGNEVQWHQAHKGIVVCGAMSVGDPQGPNHSKGGNCGVPRRKSTIRKERVKPHVWVLATGPEGRREKRFQAWHGMAAGTCTHPSPAPLHWRECVTLKEL